ncbi:hypothetical protein AXA44_29675 [Rhodococcus sp. SC4]|nr:hypothetical protein AXA44_29675 [Rhodococcus sp. SC4]
MTSSKFEQTVHRYENARAWLHLALIDSARACETTADGIGLPAKARFYRAMAGAIQDPSGPHIPLGRAAEIVGPEFASAALKTLIDLRDSYSGSTAYEILCAALLDEVVAARSAFLGAVEQRITEIWALIIEQFDPDIRTEAATWPRKVSWQSPRIAEFILDNISRAAVPYSTLTDPTIPLHIEVIDVPDDARELDSDDSS